MENTGTLSQEITRREEEHARIARMAAAQGMVLLKNDGVLPLLPGSRAALYGAGARHTIKGGTGSGDVRCRYNVSVDEGLRAAGIVITTDAWLADYDRKYEDAYRDWKGQILKAAGDPMDHDALYRAHASLQMPVPEGASIRREDVPQEDRDSVPAIYVISRVSGEGADRSAKTGDYYLSAQEEWELSEIAEVYKNIIVILNVGGVMDLSFMDRYPIKGLLLMSLAGMEGGNACADVLTGKVNPAGKLTDTWAVRYEDYPSSRTFGKNNGNLIEEKYTEGIYVGYRYFSSFAVKPRYYFGYGLSYTSFAKKVKDTQIDGTTVTVRVSVRNTGTYAGRETVFCYVSCPEGERKKERLRLAAFAKTGTVPAGESENVSLVFDLSLLESYHTGKACWYLDAGSYVLCLGGSVDECEPAAELVLTHPVYMKQVKNICPLHDALKEITPPREENELWRKEQEREIGLKKLPRLVIDKAADRLKEKESISREPLSEEVSSVLSGLTVKEKVRLVCGQPVSKGPDFIGNASESVPGAAGETAGSLKEKGIRSIVLADGPAGIRIQRKYYVNPDTGKAYPLDPVQTLLNRFFGDDFPHERAQVRYQYCTAIPTGTLLAQSFDTDLAEQVGEMIAEEMKLFHITLWLAPGMNIHRNPLCGRNFEYFSEDPLVSGLMAAALTRGVQKTPGLGVTIKHFACNNQEENRRGVSSIVSERALREIYLKGFETAVKSAQPKAIMTSYNKINGEHTANSYDLCTEAARKEWGFRGLIMTDWTTTNNEGGSSAAKCIAAGNDLVMPGALSDIKEIEDAIKGAGDLCLDLEALDESAGRVLSLVLSAPDFERQEH